MPNPTGKALLKASLDLVKQDKEMAVLPIVSACSAIVGIAVVSGGSSLLLAVLGAPTTVVAVVGLALALFIATFTATITSVAIVFAATDRLEGGSPTVKLALGQAWGRRRVIAAWTLLATAVGLVINLLQERLGAVGDVFAFLGGLAWSVATFFVVPVLAYEEVGPIEAVKRSSSVLKERFGTVVRSQVRFGFLFIGWFLLGILAVVGGFALIASSGGGIIPGVVLLVAGILTLLVVAVYSSVVNAYLRTILYRYATGRSVPDLGVNLDQAFAR